MARIANRNELCLETKTQIRGHMRRKCRACRREYARQWRKTPKGRRYERAYSKRIKGTPMELAKRAVYTELRAGRIKHPSHFQCKQCWKQAEVYSHHDYQKPLEIEPLCRLCHRARRDS